MQKKELIVHREPKSPISEVFRTLRTNIQFMSTNGKLKTILITSTFPGEGKSWISSNLAVTFAQAGKKVILIDADMRKGRQYAIFGAAPRPGLSNYLSGVNENEEIENERELREYIQETKIENLSILTAGNVPPNPLELLISSHMINLLEKLKQMYDFIIVDSTPSQLVADSLVLARLVDTTLIVTVSKKTKKDDLKRVIKNIENVGGKISGVIVNKMSISAKKYEESYYYGSTTGYKSKSSNNSKKRKSPYYKEPPMLRNEVAKRTELGTSSTIQDPLKARISKSPESNNEVVIDKTNDILKQINKYLEDEKKRTQ